MGGGSDGADVKGDRSRFKRNGPMTREQAISNAIFPHFDSLRFFYTLSCAFFFCVYVLFRSFFKRERRFSKFQKK